MEIANLEKAFLEDSGSSLLD